MRQETEAKNIFGGARGLVQIVDPDAAVHAQAERLGQLVGLTVAETRVTALLGSGLGAKQQALLAYH